MISGRYFRLNSYEIRERLGPKSVELIAESAHDNSML